MPTIAAISILLSLRIPPRDNVVMRRTDPLRGTAWVAGYLLFVLAPLFALLTGTVGPARDFWTEFSAAIGYAGLAMMGLQFGLTARFRRVTEPWGEDVLYHLHRQLSLVAVALVVAHPVILFVIRPELIGLLNVVDAPWRARFAALSVASLLVLLVTSLWRARLRIRYETWHHLHVVLAVAVVVTGLLHMVGWGVYLTDPWKRGLWIALTVFWIGLLVHVRVVRPLFMLRKPYTVTEVRAERGDTTTLVMWPDGHDGFRFEPGQFGWLTVWGGPFRITGHPFSFSGSAEAGDGSVEMSIRGLGDFSGTVGEIPVGRRVYVDGPYGAFTIGNPADMHVLIAGGVGITPMMSIIRTLADRHDSRPVVLLYGVTDWESITFREELDEIAGRLALTTVYVLTDPPPGWRCEQGFITADVLRRHVPPPYGEHEYLICGPPPMMDAMEAALGNLGVPMSKYHSERYSFA